MSGGARRRRALVVACGFALLGCSAPVTVVVPDAMLQQPIRDPLERELRDVEPRVELVPGSTAVEARRREVVVLLFGAQAEAGVPMLTAQFGDSIAAPLDEAVAWATERTGAVPVIVVPERAASRRQAVELLVAAERAMVFRVPFAEDPVRTAGRLLERSEPLEAVIVITGETAPAIAAAIDPDDGGSDARPPVEQGDRSAVAPDGRSRPLLIAELPLAAHGESLREIGVMVDAAIVYDLAGAITEAVGALSAESVERTFQVTQRFIRY